VELMTRTEAKVVLSRGELDRMFAAQIEPELLAALPRLHVRDLLEETVEDIEFDLTFGAADAPSVYWIVTSGEHDDVIRPLAASRSPRLHVLSFGEWSHGPTCTIAADGAVQEIHGPGAPKRPDALVSTLTTTEATERLHLSTLRI
jgi:hypothetical protein